MLSDVSDLFQRLESPRASESTEVKAEIAALFHSVRDPWLVQGLVKYHVRTGSARALDILVRAPDAHARFLLDQLAEGVNGDWRGSALALLAHTVRRKPLWLHRLSHHRLLPDLLTALRNERDTVPLLNGVLAVVALLPTMPALVPPLFSDISKVFARLASWNWNDPSAASRREHLQLALYALFYNLYGTYPCTLLEFLRQEYGKEANRDVFNHTVRPMMESVRLHPMLVTSSTHMEASMERWQKLEHHDVLVECRRFSLESSTEVSNQGRPARVSTGSTKSEPGPAPELTEAQTQTEMAASPAPTSTANLSRNIAALQPGGEYWFSLADNSGALGAASAPHTPLPGGELASGSPPEPAVEATPENTPVKDLRCQFSFPNESTAVRSLGRSSQPPSPLKKEPSPADTYGGRLARVVLDRVQVDSSGGLQGPSGRRSSPRRGVPGRASVPNSPIPIHSAAPDWPVPKPQPKRDPMPQDSQSLDPMNGEDREVLELTMRAEGGAHTGGNSQVTSSTGVLGPSAGVDEWEEEACPALDACRERAHGLHMPHSTSVLHFAERVATRIRSYSGCVAVGPCAASFPGLGGTAKSGRGRVGLPRGASCPDFRAARPKVISIGTQTVDGPPMPYEFLLNDVFQGLCDMPKQRLNAEAIETDKTHMSPCARLDAYLERLYEGGAGGASPAERVSRLTEQLQLTHAQLLYERWRREVHAERNRRLLGRCRRTRALEEQNEALSERSRTLTRDNDELRAQVSRLSAHVHVLEAAARTNSGACSERLSRLEVALADEKRVRERVEARVCEEAARRADETADVQRLRAEVFELSRRLEGAARDAEVGERCADHVRMLRREMMICGEREARIVDALAVTPQPQEMYAQLTRQYREELALARDAAGMATARADACAAREQELEGQLQARDALVADLKKQLRLEAEEHSTRLDAVQDSYRCLLNINRRLEARRLELLAGGTRDTSSQHSSPLSASVASSDGPLGAHVGVSDVRRLRRLLEDGASTSEVVDSNDVTPP